MNETGSAIAVAIVLIPLVVIWVMALFHIIVKRNDLSMGWKGIWFAVVVSIPYIGVLVYSFVRPPAPLKRRAGDDPTATRRAIDDVHRLVANHDAGTVTDERFVAEKDLIFGLKASAA